MEHMCIGNATFLYKIKEETSANIRMNLLVFAKTNTGKVDQKPRKVGRIGRSIAESGNIPLNLTSETSMVYLFKNDTIEKHNP